MRAQEFITEGQEKKPVTIYTNPANKGATVDDSIKKSLPVQQISFDKLQQWENHKTMQDPRVADWVNNKLLPELQQNGTLDPLSVWNNNGELFVIDGNHRFVAYQQAGYRGRVPVQIVPDNMITIVDTVMSKQAIAENKAAGINKMFNNLGDPVYANLQRVALLAMQGRQSEAAGRLQTVIKDADPAVQKKITDAVNNIKPVTINGRVADSSTLDKSKQHNDWITNTFIPWVQSLLGQQGVAEGSLNESAVFLNPTTVVVGQAHGQPLELSPDTLKKVQAIAAKHGAWYEGNGTDRSYTKGQIDRYVGSWDDEVAKTASPNDPKWLYVLFANVDENNRVQRVGVDPKDTIFNRLLAGAQDNSFQGIGYTAQALQKFLQMASEGKYDFVKMSQQPATQENLTRFLKAGEALMWPSNWEQYPNRAGKIAKAATVDVRDQYLATRKAGVYVTGSGHLKAVQNITGKQDVAENFADGKNPVKFTVTTPDGYTHSFQITLAVHGKHVGHFNFVRGADTDDVNNEAEVESRWQGQGYGKLLLMKAIDVANNHGLDFQQDIRGITHAQQNVYDSLENAGSIVTPGDGFWFLTPQGEQELNGLNENFADGKNPQDKGDSKRHGVPTKASVSTLRKVAKQGGRKGQLAHWMANMKAGRAKAKRNK